MCDSSDVFPKDIWKIILRFVDFETQQTIAMCDKNLRTVFLEIQKDNLAEFYRSNKTEKHNICFDLVLDDTFMKNLSNINFEVLRRASLVLHVIMNKENNPERDNYTMQYKNDILRQFYLAKISSFVDILTMKIDNFGPHQKVVDDISKRTEQPSNRVFFELIANRFDLERTIDALSPLFVSIRQLMQSSGLLNNNLNE